MLELSVPKALVLSDTTTASNKFTDKQVGARNWQLNSVIPQKSANLIIKKQKKKKTSNKLKTKGIIPSKKEKKRKG